jgi:hypothetical protein
MTTTNRKVISTVMYGNLDAIIYDEGGFFSLEFYKDEVLLESREVRGHSLRYVEDMAENYVMGVLTIDETGRVHGA